MTPTSPTWGDVERFLDADRWRKVRAGERGGRRQKHVHYETLLPGGRLLQTQISHSRRKTISPGRFSAILHEQLEVSREEFWKAVSTGEPVDRPAPVDEAEEVVEHEAWVVGVLVNQLHMSPEEIGRLTKKEAKRLVHEHWSKPRRS